MRRNINVWFGSPPMVERGAFDHLPDIWDGDVSYIVTAPTRDERVDLGWDQAAPPSTIQMICAEQIDKTSSLGGPDAINIFGGLQGTIRPHLDRVAAQRRTLGPIIFSERPGAYGPLWASLKRRVAIPVRQRLAARSLAERCSLMMPLGEAGLRAFSHHGWARVPQARLMYCPPASGLDVQEKRARRDKTLRLVYVGRTTRYTKGLNVLLDAIRLLPTAGWELSIVGGHGEMHDEAVRLASHDPRVTYYGPLPTGPMTEILAASDVCLVPSTFDGWNVTVNYALQLGVGVIASDQSVSHEIVNASKAGVVVPAGDAARLAREITHVLERPSLVDAWARNASAYRARISAETISGYVAECLQYVVGGASQLPAPPWLPSP